MKIVVIKFELLVALFLKIKKKSIADDFKRRCEELEIPYRKVPKEVCTRWNSLYEMLIVAYDYREPIKLVYNARNTNPDLNLCDDDWAEIKALCKFLKTFYQATHTVSAIYTPTISSVLVNITVVSSVAFEQAFSSGRFIIGDHRYSIAKDSLEISVLFRDWINVE